MEASDGIRIGKLHSKERAGEVARDCDVERAIRAPLGRATRGMLARRPKPRPRSCHTVPYFAPGRARRTARGRARLFRSHTGDGTGARPRGELEPRIVRYRFPRSTRSPGAAGARARARARRPRVPRPRARPARRLALPRAQAAV